MTRTKDLGSVFAGWDSCMCLNSLPTCARLLPRPLLWVQPAGYRKLLAAALLLLWCQGIWVGSASAATSVKAVHFVGFTGNEKVCAWQVDIERRVLNNQRHYEVQHYSLIKLIDLQQPRLLANLHASPLKHQGHFKPKPSSHLEQDDYERALPQATWQKLKQQGHFHAIAVKFDNTVVRILPDPGIELDAQVKNQQLLIKGHSPHLSYTVVGRLTGGELVPLAHFQTHLTSQPKASAVLQLFHSHSGTHIAVHNRFNNGQEDATLFITELGNPLGTVEVGFEEMQQLRVMANAKDYAQVHPETAKDYNTYIVGQWF